MAAAPTAATATASSFGRLLQAARVATWDPTIPQLHRAPPAFAARGQYGFKRAVPRPPQQQERSIDLVCPDTDAGIAVWATDNRHPRFLRAFADKGVRLREYDVNRRTHANAPRPPPATPHATVFDAAARTLLPTDAHDEPTRDLARSGLARTPAAAAAVQYAWHGRELRPDRLAAARLQYTSLDIVPDCARMSERHFDAYLDKIRTHLRPALIRHLAGRDRAPASASTAAAHAAAAARSRGVESATADAHAAEMAAARAPAPQGHADHALDEDVIVDMWGVSRALSSTYTTTFVRAHFAKKAVQAKSTILPASSGRLVHESQVPALHPNGGLQYSQPDDIYTARLHRPPGLPAHVLHRVEDPSRPGARVGRRVVFSSSPVRNGVAVSVGGHVAHLPGPLSPRHLAGLDSVYQTAELAAAAAPSNDPSAAASILERARHAHSTVLVRAMDASLAAQSSADLAREVLQLSSANKPPTGISPTAALAATAAGRPLGSAREHVVLPDPTRILVRVRPLYVDEVFGEEGAGAGGSAGGSRGGQGSGSGSGAEGGDPHAGARPLLVDYTKAAPGSRAYVGAKPLPRDGASAGARAGGLGLPGAAGRFGMGTTAGAGGSVPPYSYSSSAGRSGGSSGAGGGAGSSFLRRITPGMAARSMRPQEGGGGGGGGGPGQGLGSLWDTVSNVGSSVSSSSSSSSSSASGVAGAGASSDVPRLQRTSVGPSARPKHASNVKK